MNDIKCFKRLLRLKENLERGEKGDACYFASKLATSERTIFRLLNCLKDDYKMNIKYDRSSKSYYLD